MKAGREGREIKDEIIIKQVVRGNDHAFRLLIEKYRNYIYQSVYSVLRNEKDAEDAAQEVFIKIYSSLPNYQGKGLKTWMTRIAVHHAIDIKRKQKRRREEVTEDIGEYINTNSTNSVESLMLRKENRKLLYERMNELPENYRSVIYGYYIEEKTFQQMAEEQSLKEKTIRVKLHRARKWMRDRWKEEDFI
ncbi:RNA polymerase sigma factor [Evansella cellulosilytica]|uniref:RNA polymerase, sigma-24 subunit, ECF subfamily n=1 Tax=Evansella cellulosilytica (strain ATCC 21833 / DSM 2522 / FERM P-1141 / JCM 9156 / N-4) TaxID=649639 RepID=E6U0T5_EVAC2|nr:sigma-70 family RNA polymerase sigma factor [Evansella cellulosilytica]ADU29133.1 RNA polymerase, sigma-24 subunit, ECF subfamily [Evansella cellulosilytica DSM 2522]